MAAEILLQLWQCTLAVSCSIVLILLVRVPLRWAFGARAACWAWSLLPLGLLAVLLPRPPKSVLAAATVEQWNTAVPALAAPAAQELPWAAAILVAWLVGSVVMLCVTAIRQRRFLRSLELPVQREDGLLRSPALTSPLVVGALRPRLIIPANFEQRHPRALRTLMLAHEQQHLERGDTRIAAGAALLVCVFWFHPLVYYALRLLRIDQEMACDAAALAHSGTDRKLYAQALIDTQLAEQFGVVLPVGCHWRPAHPLKTRITMLKNPLPGRTRMIFGIVTAGLIGAGAATALWAAQPGTTADDVVVLSVQWMAQERTSPEKIGRTFRLSQANKLVPLGTELVTGFGQAPYTVACTPHALADTADGAAQWRLDCRFLREGKLLAQPVITTSEGGLPSVDMTDPESGVRLHLVVNASRSPDRIRLARQNAARDAAAPAPAPVFKSAPSAPQPVFP
jgi:beta-lactamase regulating signal transducer with metallopeptidase domain